ncbi:MAG: hypothetical protein M3415_00990 [Actinomycetota bacterium]|jgi:hypothetical protein|nr:hypothetical protein [Actinomycetota bacterium]
MRRFRGAQALVWPLCAVLLAGCQLRVSVVVDIESHGAGRLRVGVAADRALLRRAAEAGADPLADVAAAGRRLAADGWVTTDSTAADGSRTVAVAVDFADPAQLESLTADLSAALDADEVRLLEPLQLTVTADEIRVVGGAGLVPTRAVADYGLTRRGAVRLLRDNQALDYRVRLRLPGEVVSTSAPVREAATLTWPVTPGESVRIRAVGTRPRQLWRAVVAGAVGGLLALAVASLLLWRRRQARTAIRS